MPIPATPPVGSAQLNQNARTVIEKRYLIKDAKGKPTEMPENMFWRVASVVAEQPRLPQFDFVSKCPFSFFS